ncbi:MAG: hypothetical protein WAN82_03690 [Candidatus Bathyarchaeia archaeon]
MKVLHRKLYTLVRYPHKVLFKYGRLICSNLFGLITPLYGEDYNLHWNYTSFKDKVVLDLGADYGSTAQFFLQLNARKVIAVESNGEYFRKLRKNFGKNAQVVCIPKHISSPKHLESLIRLFEPDIVKVDIEGAEEHLHGVNKDAIESIKEWLIETHSHKLSESITGLLSKLNYNVQKVYEINPSRGVIVLYAKRGS